MVEWLLAAEWITLQGASEAPVVKDGVLHFHLWPLKFSTIQTLIQHGEAITIKIQTFIAVFTPP